MKRAGLLVGLAALGVLAVLGYLWREEQDTGAPIGAELALPDAKTRDAGPQDSSPQDSSPRDSSPREPTPSEAPAAAEATPETRGETPGETPAESGAGAPAPAQVARISPLGDADEAAPATRPSATRPRIETREVAPPADPHAAAVLPSFDIVRVEPNGETVVAGRATPGSLVRLFVGDTVLAETAADTNGEWVIVLREPLAPGSHEFSLESQLGSGEALLSETIVVVSVPEPALVAEAPGAPGVRDEAASAAAPARETESGIKTGAETGIKTGAETLRPLAVLMSRRGEGASRVIQAPEPVPRHLGREALLLETVDYDATGRAVIGGRGKAGVTVVVYLNGRLAGRTVIGPGGRWQVTLDGRVPFGVHTLRVDQLDASGRVVARVESPFSRAEIQTAMAQETAVIVQPGNSLWRIARRLYGEGFRYSVIFDANRSQIRDPDLIYPGQVFVVPKTN